MNERRWKRKQHASQFSLCLEIQIKMKFYFSANCAIKSVTIGTKIMEKQDMMQMCKDAFKSVHMVG